MKCKAKHHLGSHLTLLLTVGILAIPNAKSASLTWNGAAANGNWSLANWGAGTPPVNSGTDALTFAGSTNRSTTNNLTSYTASSIIFDRNAGAFILAGNAITLGGDITFSGNPSAAITQTINLDMAFSAQRTLTVRGNGNLAIGGKLSGAGGINITTANGTGTLELAGDNSYSGGTALTAATLRVANNNALGTGDLTFNSTGTIQASGSGVSLANNGTFITLSVSGTENLTFGGKLAGLSGGSRTINNNIASGKTLTLTNLDISLEAVSNSLTIGGTGNTDIVGVIAPGNTTNGNKTLIITNTGVTKLTGVNTYTASATVNAGTLLVSGSGSINASSGTSVDGGNAQFRYESTVGLSHSIAVKNGGTFSYNSAANYVGTLTFTNGKLAGTNWNGTLGGLTIGANQTISPGNSPGTASTTSQTWANLGSYNWEINKATGGSAGTDPGWDLINLSSTLTISADSTSKFTINVISLKLDNSAGTATGFDASLNYTWLIADSANAISGFAANKFIINTTGFTNAFNGTFSVALGNTIGAGDNTQLFLTYTAIPEPSTTALIGLAAGYVFLFRRRSNV